MLNAHMFTSCTAKSQLLYVQLVGNSVKEGGKKKMKNDFLNPTKSNVNLKNYTNINLFYNYRIRYSIPFTESQEEIMFLIQSSWLAIEKLEIAIQYHNISKRSIKSWNIQMSYIFLNSVSFSS